MLRPGHVQSQSPSSSVPIELDDQPSRSPGDCDILLSTTEQRALEQEAEPLLSEDSDLITPLLSRRERRPQSSTSFSGQSKKYRYSGVFRSIMEKESKIRLFARKLAVESEPGLTNAQLMLTNKDLKPGMFCRAGCGLLLQS